MIKKLLARPYHLFLLIAALLLILSFFNFKNSVDFHLHDTYYVVDSLSANWGLSLIFWFFWMIYHFAYPILYSNKLIWWHLAGIIISITAIILYGQFQLSVPRHYYEYANFDQGEAYQQIGRMIAIAVIAIQFLYPINLALGLIKRLRNKEGNQR